LESSFAQFVSIDIHHGAILLQSNHSGYRKMFVPFRGEILA